MREDESLTPASRLNSDSATSPTCAASASSTSATEPRGCASECGPWRIAMVKASRAEAYRLPNTVTDTVVSGRRVGPRVIATTSTASSHSAATYSTGSQSANPLTQKV